MGSPEVRELTENDIDEFCRVRLESLVRYPVAYGMMPDLFKKASMEAKIAQLNERKTHPPNFVLGCFDGTRLTGLIGFKVHIRDSVRHKGTMWGFYVDPEFQSQGRGRKLLSEYIARIQEMGSIKQHRLMTPVGGENAQNAINLFESVGFERYGHEPCAVSDGKNIFDQYYYCMLTH